MILTTKSIGATINTQEGIISLMYHRFEENKYPSTNIKNEIFLQHLNEINKLKIEFISFEKFGSHFNPTQLNNGPVNILEKIYKVNYYFT